MSTATSTGVPELENDAASGISFRVREPADGSPARATLLLLHGVGGNESQLLSLAPLPVSYTHLTLPTILLV